MANATSQQTPPRSAGQAQQNGRRGPLARLRRFWTEGELAYIVGGFALGLLTRSVIDQLASDGIIGFLADLVPEGVGILFTVLFIDRLNDRREARRREEDTKERLIREAGSASNIVAKAAISELYRRDWLQGEAGLLAGERLHYADLREANLYYANLRRADLRRADLRGADLVGADLTGADLRGANLQGAKLAYINPKDPTDQRRAVFSGVECSAETTLPDGTLWGPGCDWTRFGAEVDEVIGDDEDTLD